MVGATSMRIVYVGDVNEGARSAQRFGWLRRLGHSVSAIPTVPLDGRVARRLSIADRVLSKLGYPRDSVAANAKLLAAAEDQPDVVWVDRGDTIWPTSLQRVRAIAPRTRLLYFSEDDVYLQHNRSVFLTHALREFDIVFTTKPRNVAELPLLGAKRVSCIFQAYDPLLHRPVTLTREERAALTADVSFVGSYEVERARSMRRLADSGISIRVFGSGWQRSGVPNLDIVPGHIATEEFVRVVNASHINLNYLRRANRDQHTSRSLEIPACGGFMLAERSGEHQQLFREGLEAEFFDDDDELVSKCQRYLADAELRVAVARAGRARCLASGYGHPDRLREMLAALAAC